MFRGPAFIVYQVRSSSCAGVHGFHTVPRETLRNQIECVLSDIGADVVKTGMLPSAEVRVALELLRVSFSRQLQHCKEQSCVANFPMCRSFRQPILSALASVLFS